MGFIRGKGERRGRFVRGPSRTKHRRQPLVAEPHALGCQFFQARSHCDIPAIDGHFPDLFSCR